MDIFNVINTRRSVRRFKDEPLPHEKIMELLQWSVTAASSTNSQPWGFVVIEGKETIEQLSDQVRADLKSLYSGDPSFHRYERWLENPDFNFFFRSHNLILIYGNSDIRFYRESCTLAVSNLMLAAHAMGIGSCWIGFAFHTCNAPEFKRQWQVPPNYELVAVLTLGYKKDHEERTMERKAPLIFNRSEPLEKTH